MWIPLRSTRWGSIATWRSWMRQIASSSSRMLAWLRITRIIAGIATVRWVALRRGRLIRLARIGRSRSHVRRWGTRVLLRRLRHRGLGWRMR